MTHSRFAQTASDTLPPMYGSYGESVSRLEKAATSKSEKWRIVVFFCTILMTFFLACQLVFERERSLFLYPAISHRLQQPRIPPRDHFPLLNETVEMAALSLLVYSFRDVANETSVCDSINHNIHLTDDSSDEIPLEILKEVSQWHCHWYHHDRVEGTQILLVTSLSQHYHAVVYAGTDDLRTSLTDATVWTTPFGTADEEIVLPDNRIRIHRGFNSAVFQQNIYTQIESRLLDIIRTYPAAYALYATGHSLGAANAVLTTVAWNWRRWEQRQQEGKSHKKWYHKIVWPWSRRHHKSWPDMKSINFGCPRIGNVHWRDFVHSNHPAVEATGIWRVVLGWDLVPRLPELFYHEGHTIQMYKQQQPGSTNTSMTDKDQDFRNGTALAYYRHYGNDTLAGVPAGWYAKPFLWVPGALSSHHIYRYWHILHEWSLLPHEEQPWSRVFEPVQSNDDDDGMRPPGVDDDFWVNPPDDDAAVVEEQR